jgi:hypothetical protein
VAASEEVTSPLGPPPGLTLRARPAAETRVTFRFHRPPLPDGTVDWSGIPVHSNAATSARRNPPTGLSIRAFLPGPSGRNQGAGTY